MLIVMTKMMMMMMMNETYLHTWSELMLVVLVDISEFLAFPSDASTLIHPQGRLAKMQISSGVQFVLQRMPQHLGPHYLPAAHLSPKHFPGWPAPGYLTAKVSTQSQRRGNLILEGFSRASQGLHELLRPWDFALQHQSLH